VSENSVDVIRRYLDDAIAAEKSFETQLRGFAQEGDDEEVQAAFRAHADQTRVQYERLTQRLETLGGSPSTAKSLFAHLFALTPKAVQLGHSPAERLAQNLIVAFAAEKSECAMYEALASVAAAAGDESTEKLVREIQAEESEAADKIWRFIPTRSKIAFNLLTAGEIDPAIETKAPDDRVI
jgi:ferritin-like metal-binding protein YciE